MVVYLLGTPDPNQLLLSHFALYVFWYVMMQIFLLRHIQVWRKYWERKFSSSDMDKYLTKKDMEGLSLSLECVAPLLSVACSASGMILWAALQARLVRAFPFPVAVALSIVPVNFIVSEILVLSVQWFRDYFNSADGTVDKLDVAWTGCVAGCERNLVAYQTSFLFVQALRLAITGILPLPNGLDPPGFQASARHMLILFGISYFFIAVLIAGKIMGLDEGKTIGSRLAAIVLSSWGNTIAFCWLYSATWLFELTIGTVVIAAVFQASSATIIGVFIISLLVDGDEMKRHDTVEKELATLVTPLSVWIGFTWQQAFKLSLAGITGYQNHLPVPVATALLAVVVVSSVFPIWKHYVLVQEHLLRNAMATKRDGTVNAMEYDKLQNGDESTLEYPLLADICCMRDKDEVEGIE
jgi:hypothetical protein